MICKTKLLQILLWVCYNIIWKLDLIQIKLIKIYIILNQKKNFLKNLILIMEYFQEKELLEQLKNVIVKQIIKNMLSNIQNKKKDLLILLNYKLDNNLKI